MLEYIFPAELLWDALYWGLLPGLGTLLIQARVIQIIYGKSLNELDEAELFIWVTTSMIIWPVGLGMCLLSVVYGLTRPVRKKLPDDLWQKLSSDITSNDHKHSGWSTNNHRSDR